MVATYNEHIKTVKILLEWGADVNAKGADGETPVDAAANPETTDFLRKLGGKTGAE